MDAPVSSDWWRQWLNQHAARLLLYARQQARCASDAEDLLQESLVEAWQRMGAETPPPVPLVVATIRRRAIDHARSADRRQRRESIAGAGEEVWFDPAPAHAENIEWIEKALRQLPDEQREIITLKIWGEMTFAEIATALDISPNTAASRYRYGMERLKLVLSNEQA